jgi:hypothetical protein
VSSMSSSPLIGTPPRRSSTIWAKWMLAGSTWRKAFRHSSLTASSASTSARMKHAGDRSRAPRAPISVLPSQAGTVSLTVLGLPAVPDRRKLRRTFAESLVRACGWARNGSLPDSQPDAVYDPSNRVVARRGWLAAGCRRGSTRAKTGAGWRAPLSRRHRAKTGAG